MCIAWFAVFGRSYLLLYHLFHSLLCTISVPMYTAGESVIYLRSDGSLVPATVLGPGAQSETVQIEYRLPHPGTSSHSDSWRLLGANL